MLTQDLIFLVADDDPDEHYLIHTAIQEINSTAEIHSVFTGFQLFEFLFNKGMYEDVQNPLPHVIIADINMPVLNGFDVIKSVKETEQLKDIVIYILTTSTREEDKLKALTLGADGYYTKSNNFEKLKEIMKEIETKIKK